MNVGVIDRPGETVGHNVDVLEDDVRHMTTAQFRDRHKTSRKYAIPLLEYFDRTGVTVRVGEVRRLKDRQTKMGTP